MLHCTIMSAQATYGEQATRGGLVPADGSEHAMRTNILSILPATGRSAARPGDAAPTRSAAPALPGGTYDAPGFAGTSFSQQVPDLLSEMRLNRHDASGWGAAGTRFPE